VKDPKDDHSVALDHIWNHVGQSLDDQFAGVFAATGTPHTRVPRQLGDMVNYGQHRIDGGRRVIATDVVLDQVEIAASDARPS